VRLDAEGRWYQRVQLTAGYEVWLISWLPGQSTGFHDHGGSAGAFGVVWGSLDECMVPRDRTRALVNQVIAGEVRAFGPGYVHDVRNSAAGTVAVSVHAYSPPLCSMTVYNLTPGGLVAAAILYGLAQREFRDFGAAPPSASEEDAPATEAPMRTVG